MPIWFTPQLAEQVRKVFEPKYQRALTDNELFEIAENLTSAFEVTIKHDLKMGYK